MELTDNCRNEFQIWAISHEELKFKNILGLFCINIYGFWIPFYLLNDVIKYGVLVDFFDSVDIVIEIQVHVSPTMQGGNLNGFKPCILHKGRFVNVQRKFVKRYEARAEAIKKANEILN